MDILDTRDLNERLEEIEDDIETLKNVLQEAQEELDESEDDVPDADLIKAMDKAREVLDDYLYDTEEELNELRQLRAEIIDWKSGGATLINEDAFEEYAEELAEDVGAISRINSWPCTHIDWTAAAEELKGDYYEVQYQGNTYLVR